MSTNVLLRLARGVGGARGRLARARALALALRARGGEALFFVDDEEPAAELRRDGLEAWSVAARPHWALERAAGAWIDGAWNDWSQDLRRLARRDTPSHLVENRSSAREWAGCVVQPTLFYEPDAWERVHRERVLCGAPWIPLGAAPRAVARDLELLIYFDDDEAADASARVLACLPAGLRVAVSLRAVAEARRPAVARSAAHLEALWVSGTELTPWMSRARAAVTEVGPALFELAHLRTPALILGRAAEDRRVLALCAGRGPFHALGLASELDPAALRARIEEARRTHVGPSAPVAGLGTGAANLAERLLGRVVSLAA